MLRTRLFAIQPITKAFFCLFVALFSMSSAAELPEAIRDFCPQEDLREGGKPVTVRRGSGQFITLGSPSFANAMVEFLRNRQEIEYGYVIDGCNARAYLGAKALYDDYKIYTARINLDQTRPSLSFSDDRTAERYVEFWSNKHSALLTCVKTPSDEVVPYVLEPTFSREALTYAEWISLLREGTSGTQRVFVSSMFNISQYSSRREQKFSNTDLACAQQTMITFTEELARVRRLYGRYPFASRMDSSGQDRRHLLLDIRECE